MPSEPVDVGLRRVYERHLDLLVAEELECNERFLRWFLEECFGPIDIQPSGVRVVVGHVDDMEGNSQNAGEDDLLVEARLESGDSLVVLIENKIDAVLQPRQIDRYVARARRYITDRNASAATVAAVAPQSYLERHRDDLQGSTVISVEQMARELEDQASGSSPEIGARLRWRAARLTHLETVRSQPAASYQPTVELRDWLIAAIHRRDHTIDPDPGSMRTSSTSWLSLRDPSSVWFKVGHDCVDIYLSEALPAGVSKETALADLGLPEGFVDTTDSKKNPILRFGYQPLQSIDELWQDGPVDEARLHQLVDACVRACAWVRVANTLRTDSLKSM